LKTISVGSDFSGVGAFDFAIQRVAEQKGFNVKNIFACDWDKFARQSYLANHDAPEYYPHDVYERDIPKQPLDFYMSSPPCQGFSLSGSRKSKEDDKRNILFYNSHEFIVKNKPRYFVFDNVRGLMSHENGNTFQEWINLLGGKSVNGLPVLFPHDKSVPYHIYYAVLNTKKIANIPQNRERVFIIGIRDDADNNFRFPIEQPLTIKLKDLLEDNVNKKYFLSYKMIKYFLNNTKKQKEKGNGFKWSPMEKDETYLCNAVTTKFGSRMDDTFLKIPTNNKKGFEKLYLDDSLNLDFVKSTTRRGRVGHKVSQTIDTHSNIGVFRKYKLKRLNNFLSETHLPDDKVLTIDCYSKSLSTQVGCITTKHDSSPNNFLWDSYFIRRLTPRECFRLQGFNDDFKFVVSDAQLYKQAGNSITIGVLEKILNNFNF